MPRSISADVKNARLLIVCCGRIRRFSQHPIPRQIRVHHASVLGVGGRHELAFAYAQQVVFPDQAMHPLGIHDPIAPAGFFGRARLPVARPFQRDLPDPLRSMFESALGLASL